MESVKLGKTLIVDDEPELASALKETLSPQGYEIEEFTSGKTALEALKEKDFPHSRPDMFLLKITQLVCDGLQPHSGRARPASRLLCPDNTLIVVPIVCPYSSSYRSRLGRHHRAAAGPQDAAPPREDRYAATRLRPCFPQLTLVFLASLGHL
jgi:hypothetical protein